MILSATLSKPTDAVRTELGRPYQKIKIRVENTAGATAYHAELFTASQAFHRHFSESELEAFLSQCTGRLFKNCITRTEHEEITALANKKGKITELRKPLRSNPPAMQARDKKRLLPEGVPVPFLVATGIMTSDGKVVKAKYDKFRQINRFLEFIDDLLPALTAMRRITEDEPLRIADFGCGKSYLTFATHYFLSEVRQIPCKIEGLDLKQDVIDFCNSLVHRLGLDGIEFRHGDISGYSGTESPDLVMTLHACDTATDFALRYAVSRGAAAILSVPCCQHEVNTQLAHATGAVPEEFGPLLKWGIIREKFSALVTDALRGEWLEHHGYKVQLLEFIDEEHTPKNILIRAVKKSAAAQKSEPPELLRALNITPEIWRNE